MIIFFALALISFLFPVGLYPVQDFVRDYIMAAAAIALMVFVALKSGRDFFVPRLLIWLAPLFSVFLFYFVSREGSEYSYFQYALAFVFVVIFSISVANSIFLYGYQRVVIFLSRFLVCLSVLSVFFALFRYYGALKYIVPIVTADGDRLIGPMGQPNLMGVLVSLGIGSTYYLVYIKKSISVLSGGLVLCVLYYAAPLTGSRSAIILLIVVSILFLYYRFRLTKFSGFVSCSGLGTALLPIVFLILSLFLVPKIDSVISAYLNEAGYLNRVNADEMVKRIVEPRSNGRVAEWSKVFSGIYPDSLWTGHGIGRYGAWSNKAEVALNYRGNGAVWNHAHNIFVQFYVEWGVVGFLAFLVICFWVVKLAFLKLGRGISGDDFVPVVILCVFVFHSLVEFSLWYIPFLAIFLTALVLLGGSTKFSWSRRYAPKVLALIILVYSVTMFLYVGKDVLTVLRVMYKDQVVGADLWALEDASRSRIVGYFSNLVMVSRFPPLKAGSDRALVRYDELSSWRPYPLYKVREASLSTLYLPFEEACAKISELVVLYPDSVGLIQMEIAELEPTGSMGEVLEFDECVVRGAVHWTVGS